MKNNTATIIAAVIGAVATISAAFIGRNIGEKNAIQQLYSQVTTINGDNNTVTVNSIDDFITQYNKLTNENETLKAQNSQYFADYMEQKNINVSLESQLIDNPVISYNNIGLCMDVQDIPINKNNSMVTIDGRDYFSREIVESLIPDDQNMTIKEDTLFIGKVIADKANLFDQIIMDQYNCEIQDTATDSYGNVYTNLLFMQTQYNYNHDYIIYVLNGQYSLLRFSASIRDNAKLDRKGVLTIKADDQVVYTSDSLNKKTELFSEIDIPINFCKLLTIEYDSEEYCGCIISDAIVYN